MHLVDVRPPVGCVLEPLPTHRAQVRFVTGVHVEMTAVAGPVIEPFRTLRTLVLLLGVVNMDAFHVSDKVGLYVKFKVTEITWDVRG